VVGSSSGSGGWCLVVCGAVGWVSVRVTGDGMAGVISSSSKMISRRPLPIAT